MESSKSQESSSSSFKAELPPTRTSAVNLPPTITAWQTQIRQSLTPYLPPPVVTALHQLDGLLEPHVGPEASITLAGSFFLAWMVLSMVTWIARSAGVARGKRGRAIAEENDDEDDPARRLLLSSSGVPGMKDQQFQATVLLCGPVNAGKTCLFYELCHGESNLPTLMSLTANVGISSGGNIKKQSEKSQDEDNDEEDCQTSIRYVDWPGHARLDETDSVLQAVFSNAKLEQPLRIVLVLDATQPVSAAADVLYQLLSLAHQHNKQRRSNKQNATTTTPWPILVACHKKDFPKAKNAKRVKIQIRTELERLLKVKSNEENAENELWWPAAQPLELEDLPFARLCFVATTCHGKGCPEVRHFCTTGEFPNE